MAKACSLRRYTEECVLNGPRRHPSRDETDTGHAMQTWEATVNRVFIEIHTDASGTGAGGNEIIPSGWYHLAEALKVLETARLTITQEIINVEWARLGAKDNVVATSFPPKA